MATKLREKQVAEIKLLQDKLPDLDFQIEIKNQFCEIKVSTYLEAVNLLSRIFARKFNLNEMINLPAKYAFASIATDKEIKKEVKISIYSLIHKNK